jgi:hypothetical protein
MGSCWAPRGGALWSRSRTVSCQLPADTRRPHRPPRRYWQCQPAGYISSQPGTNAGATVTLTITQTIPSVTAANVNAGALANGMQTQVCSAAYHHPSWCALPSSQPLLEQPQCR